MRQQETETEALVYQTFGARVKSKRVAKQITQTDLAEEVGITRASIANIESGRHRVLLHVAIRLCRILKMKPLE